MHFVAMLQIYLYSRKKQQRKHFTVLRYPISLIYEFKCMTFKFMTFFRVNTATTPSPAIDITAVSPKLPF